MYLGYYTVGDMQGLPAQDIELIVAANDTPWEEIREEKAQHQRAREILHEIQMRKMHRDFASCGMI